jgi:hypothetical protein
VLASAPLVAYSLGLLLSYTATQLGGAAVPTDFVNYYTAGRTFLETPGNLYRPDAEAARQRLLADGQDIYSQFQNLPLVALLMAPLAVLPYGVAYLAYWLLNLGLLAGSAALLAPARWPLWTLLALFFLPVEFALVDGQTSFWLLFGFAASIRLRAPLWLLAWALKPQLLPLPLLALVLAHKRKSAALLVLVPLALTALVLSIAGWDSLPRYLQLTRAASQDTLARINLPGQTVLGLAQSLLGVGAPATVLAVAAAAVLCALVGWLWWGGLRPDPRRHLQLAMLPVAAVLAAPRANTYELTLWLASAWLLLRYARDVPAHRRYVLLALFVGWWGGNLAFIAERGSAFEWGTLAGVAILALSSYLLRQWTGSDQGRASLPT